MPYFKNKNEDVRFFSELQVNQGFAKDCGKITDSEAEELLIVEKAQPTEKELAAESQSYLDSTDWIEAKYVREVVRNKSMAEEEFNLKYSVELDKREDAIAVISDYEDSL